MHPSLAQAIFADRGIIYLVTDRLLTIKESGGASDLLHAHLGDWVGRSLLEAVPELLGSEAALADMLAGLLPRLHIPWVNRDLPDGQTRYLTLVALPYRDDEGAIRGLLQIIQDVTELGQLEQRVMQQKNELLLLRDTLHLQNRQLEAANIELHRLDEIKSAFISIAAHELRTPLASISGYLEMLLDGDAGALAPRQAEWLRLIEGSARRLLRITSDLLDVARLEMGRLELVMQPTDLVAVVQAVIAEQMPQADMRGQRVQLEAQAALPAALCDATRAAQVIGNLLNNALKYAPPGSLVRVDVRAATESGFIQVSVADQGPGIPPEYRDQLFHPFSRLPMQVTGSVSGTGLGLYIAHSLVELHGGRLWLESLPGQGATFHVTFPQASIPLQP